MKHAQAGHPTADEIAAYLDDRLDSSARARLEDHFADCDSCADEIAEAARTLLRERTRRRRHTWIGPVVAAAAVVLVAVPLFRSAESAGEPRLREGSGPSARALQVLRPADGSLVSPDSLIFVWRDIADDATYSFRLTDGVGDILYEATSPDTTADLTGRVVVRAGRRYFWYVDALFAGGQMVGTGVREFEVRE